MADLGHRSRPTLGLVHSPLVGPSSLAPWGAALREAGWRVCMPSLEGVFDSPSADRADVVAAAADQLTAVGGPLVLVGHSGAGPLLPAIADRLPDVVGQVYVDAVLPGPARAWVDEAPPTLVSRLRELVVDGILPPWPTWFPDADLPAMPDAPSLPWAWFTAPGLPGELPERWGYLQLSDAYPESVATAAVAEVPLARLIAGHLAPMTHPREAANALSSVVESLISHI